MKYIKSYTTLEGIKSKFEEELQIRKKLEKFAPGSFLIILYKRWSKLRNYSDVLALIRVNNIDIINEPESNSYNIKKVYYIKIQILDYVSEEPQDLEKNSFTDISINSKVEYLFTSNSRKECQDKFEELKEDQIIGWETKKYNI